jgi:hypothetical protein
MLICLFSSVGLAFIQDQMSHEQNQKIEQQENLDSLK